MADLNKLLTDISRSIVDDPDGVTVTETTDDNDTVCFELKVSEKRCRKGNRKTRPHSQSYSYGYEGGRKYRRQKSICRYKIICSVYRKINIGTKSLHNSINVAAKQISDSYSGLFYKIKIVQKDLTQHFISSGGSFSIAFNKAKTMS